MSHERARDIREHVAGKLILARELDRAVQLDDRPAPLGVRHEIDPDERSSDYMRRDQSELARLPRNVRNRTANPA